jgi:hypothetical protein
MCFLDGERGHESRDAGRKDRKLILLQKKECSPVSTLILDF